MTNDDKQFFKGLITDLDQKWDKRFEGLQDEVRHNGFLIERVEVNVSLLSEQVQDFNTKLSEVRTDVAEIKESICDYPIVRKLVQKHERQLAKIR